MRDHRNRNFAGKDGDDPFEGLTPSEIADLAAKEEEEAAVKAKAHTRS